VYLYRGFARAPFGHYEQAMVDLQAAEARHPEAIAELETKGPEFLNEERLAPVLGL